MVQPPQRPTAVLTIAVFHFIFGGLGLLCLLCLLGVRSVQSPEQAQMQAQTEMIMLERVPFYTIYQIAGAALGLILTVVMLASATGLLSCRPWARQLSIFYGITALIWGILPSFTRWFG
jgi:hypothetical protein